MADLDCTVAEFCNPHSTWGRITGTSGSMLFTLLIIIGPFTYVRVGMLIGQCTQYCHFLLQLESIKKKTGISEIPTSGRIQIRYHVLKTLQENSIDIRRMQMISL